MPNKCVEQAPKFTGAGSCQRTIFYLDTCMVSIFELIKWYLKNGRKI